MSLYNKYRPTRFEDVYGQDAAVELLRSVVAMPLEERPQVFLLAGASGCGKTTLAKVFARAIGVDPERTDFTTQDASKDRGIDAIRALCNAMGNRPMGRGAQGRVFLIDECHQLTKAAQESLLKKCEDTPPGTYVFFCTTEPAALGKALRSRCKCINIQPMSNASLIQNMKRVAKAEGINISDADLKTLADNADGSARESLQLLESYALHNGDADKTVALAAGACEQLQVDTREVCRALIRRDGSWDTIVDFCNNYRGQSESVRQAVLGYFRGCLLKSTTPTDRSKFIALIECFLEPHYDCGDAALVYQMAMAFELKFG